MQQRVNTVVCKEERLFTTSGASLSLNCGRLCVCCLFFFSFTLRRFQEGPPLVRRTGAPLLPRLGAGWKRAYPLKRSQEEKTTTAFFTLFYSLLIVGSSVKKYQNAIARRILNWWTSPRCLGPRCVGIPKANTQTMLMHSILGGWWWHPELLLRCRRLAALRYGHNNQYVRLLLLRLGAALPETYANEAALLLLLLRLSLSPW